MSVRVGTSGWNYRSWRGTVYPRGLPVRRWLEHYAAIFDTVDVNATFYRLPKPDERLSSFLDGLPPGRHCVELRHESWFASDVYALLRERDWAIGSSPENAERYARFARGARRRTISP